ELDRVEGRQRCIPLGIQRAIGLWCGWTELAIPAVHVRHHPTNSLDFTGLVVIRAHEVAITRLPLQHGLAVSTHEVAALPPVAEVWPCRVATGRSVDHRRLDPVLEIRVEREGQAIHGPGVACELVEGFLDDTATNRRLRVDREIDRTLGERPHEVCEGNR